MKIAIEHNKECKTAEKMRKEVAILNFLAVSDICEMVPKVVSCSERSESNILKTYIIEGLPPIDESPDQNLMYCLGILAKKIHQIGNYYSFGSFDENLMLYQQVNFFSEFVERKINNWVEWHCAYFNEAFVGVYCNWIWKRFEVMRSYFDFCKPLFCHGDFDLKNVLVRADIVTALVDWEHSGVYCIEWELRKLSRFYHQQPEIIAAFFEGYGYYEKNMNTYPISMSAICFLEAADLLGHLKWCRVHDLKDEYMITISRMHQFLN